MSLSIIRETDRKAINGQSIVEIKRNGKWETYVVNDEDESLTEYDESIDQITFSYTNKDGEIVRTELSKDIFMVDGMVVGVHRYQKPDDSSMHVAVVCWRKLKDKWVLKLNKGLQGFSEAGIKIVAEHITAI